MNEEDKQEEIRKKTKKALNTPTSELNLSMYLYAKHGVEKDTGASVWYLGPRWIGETWMCPGLFEEMLAKDPEVKQLVEEGDREKLKTKILKIFKDKYIMLLWSRFNSIREIVTDYVAEKVKTKEWESFAEEAVKEPDEKTSIEFKKVSY